MIDGSTTPTNQTTPDNIDSNSIHFSPLFLILCFSYLTLYHNTSDLSLHHLRNPILDTPFMRMVFTFAGHLCLLGGLLLVLATISASDPLCTTNVSGFRFDLSPLRLDGYAVIFSPSTSSCPVIPLGWNCDSHPLSCTSNQPALDLAVHIHTPSKLPPPIRVILSRPGAVFLHPYFVLSCHLIFVTLDLSPLSCIVFEPFVFVVILSPLFPSNTFSTALALILPTRA